MSWERVGRWLRDNGGTGAALVGSLLTGNVPTAVAAAAALVGSATGEADPDRALQVMQRDPATVLRLRELTIQEAASIREHVRATEEARQRDAQEAHRQQQETIRTGDTAADPYVRHTRPMLGRQSWYVTAAYVVGFEAARAAGYGSGASVEFAALLASPAWAYLGFRSLDKFTNGRVRLPRPPRAATE